MKLQTRLKLTSAATIASVAMSIGGFAIVRSHQVTLAHIDQALNAVILSAASNYDDPLSEALVATADTDLTLAYVSLHRKIVVVRGSQTLFTRTPKSEDFRHATSEGVTARAQENIRMRTIEMPDNEYIIVAQSLHTSESQDRANVQALLSFVVFVSICGVLIIGRILKRDFTEVDELIQSATDISTGKIDIQIQPRIGNSEIDQLAQALERMIDSLKESVELERNTHIRMQEFLGDASHELRTPLTVIKGYVELLAADAISSEEPYTRYFMRVTTEIERMESLIKDLLLLAELGDEYVLPLEHVALSHLVQVHAQDFSALEPDRPTSFMIEPDIEIEGSTALTQQLISNVFSNVRTHTPKHAPLEVELSRNDNDIRLVFNDGGPGLPQSTYHEETLHFRRFDSSRSRDTGGSGLGMSIISAIVRQHGGTIDLSKSHLGGLQTTIILPATGTFV
jgi:two-component system, OmpR family, sensor kinase